MSPSMVRKIALAATIFFDVAMLIFWALAKHWGFFWCFVAITVIVLVFEVLNVFVWYGKTLSTEAKHKIEQGGRNRAFIYLAISCMLLAMLSLSLHLGWV